MNLMRINVYIKICLIFNELYFLVCRFERRQIFKTYRLSEKGVQTLVWQNQAKAWTPTKIFI
jgi:hypothetical protein